MDPSRRNQYQNGGPQPEPWWKKEDGNARQYNAQPYHRSPGPADGMNSRQPMGQTYAREQGRQYAANQGAPTDCSFGPCPEIHNRQPENTNRQPGDREQRFTWP